MNAKIEQNADEEETTMADVGAEKHIISVFPNPQQAAIVDQLVLALNTDWKYHSLAGNAASRLLDEGERLRRSLSARASAALTGELAEQKDFSQKAVDCLPTPLANARYLVLSPSLVPFDLVHDATGTWGERSIFSHILLDPNVPSSPFVNGASDTLSQALYSTQRPIKTYLLLCPMKMDRLVPRHQQDILMVASALEDQLAVEIWLQPPLQRSEQALSRKDVSWLHVDTHGDRTGRYWMLGATREGGQLVSADGIPEHMSIPLVMVVGCALTAGIDAVGSVLFQRGVQSVVGPCTIFQSLGVANSEEGEASWYKTFFSALLQGNDVGTSLLKARQSIRTQRVLKYAWLILGSSLLSFQNR